MQYISRGINLDKIDRKRIMTLTLPAMVELLFSQLFAMVDTVMLGQTSMSAIAIAAVGLTTNPTNVVNGVMTAMNIGTSAAVAWAVGGKDFKSARQIARVAITINVIFGLFASLLMFFSAQAVVTFMGAEPDTLVYATQYMQITAWGMLPACIGYGVTSALRGSGETRLPMIYNLIANLFNVIGNYVLIYGKFGMPEMGIAGAALSTTISRCIAGVLALFTLYFRKNPIQIPVRGDYWPRIATVKQIAGVGVTSMLEQLLMQVGFIFFAKTVSGLGTAVFAAHQIGLSVNGLTWMPSQAFGVAATTLVGQAIGAGEKNKAREFMRQIRRYSLLTAVIMSAMFLTLSHPITRLYTNDAEVARMAGTVLKLIALGMPGICIQLPLSAGLRGAGDAKYPLISSAVSIWFFRVLVAPVFVYTFGWGLNGAWYTIVLDQTLRAVILSWRFSTNKWMDIRKANN